MDLPRRALDLLWSVKRTGGRGRCIVETFGGRVFVNLFLESRAENTVNNRNTEKPKQRRKPSLRDNERLKAFNTKKAEAAKKNKDTNLEDSSEVENNVVSEKCLSGNQKPTPTSSDEEKDMGNVSGHKDDVTEKPVESEVVTDSEDNENKLAQMDTNSIFLRDSSSSAKVLLQQQQAAVEVVGMPMTQSTAVPGPGQPSQRVFTGSVTKAHKNFGFVDGDVFFQISAVKGDIPRIHDRVLVEASFNSNLPFKWNASRVQVLPNQSRIK